MDKIPCLLVGLLLLDVTGAFAQVRVDTGVYGVQVGQGGGVIVNTQPGNQSTIGSDVQVGGITIINGNLFIDGEKVARGKSTYTSKKTQKSYKIDWGKDGNISVTEK